MIYCLMAERQDIEPPNQLKLTLDTTIGVVMNQSDKLHRFRQG